jgi:AraC family transcriptional regulator
MSYLKSIQKAIDFIEENLLNDITIEQIASKASYSPYHFHRIFSSVMGCSVKAYLTRRRLTSAAYEVNQTNRRIIDIATDYGYESQEAFTRSFQRAFSITPGQYRKRKPYVEFLGKIDITDIYETEAFDSTNIEPALVEIEPFYVIGVEKKNLEIAGSLQRDKTVKEEIPDAWFNFISRLHEIQGNQDSLVTYGIGRPTGGGIHFSYIAGARVDSSEENVPNRMVCTQVPGGSYASFSYFGQPSNIPKLSNFIYGTWLPTTNYQLNFGVEIEKYTEKPDPEGNIFVEIMIPIKKE